MFCLLRWHEVCCGFSGFFLSSSQFVIIAFFYAFCIFSFSLATINCMEIPKSFGSHVLLYCGFMLVFWKELYHIFCTVTMFCCVPPPAAMNLTTITTEKTSMTGKRKDSMSLSILLPFRGSRVRVWKHGLLALLIIAITRRLILLTSHRPEADCCLEAQYELNMSLLSNNNRANMVPEAV